MSSRTALATLLFWLVGCGGAAPPRPASPPDEKAAKDGAPAATTTRGELANALAKIAAPAPVLDGLAPKARADLDALAQALGPEAKRQVLSPDGASARPLLHLALGGNSPDALFMLATSRRLADELVSLRAIGATGGWSELVQSTREVSRRAATRWLREHAGKVRDAFTPALAEKVDQAADTLDRTDLRRLARKAAVEADPTPERWIALARAEMWLLNVDVAKAALSKVKSSDEKVLEALKATESAMKLAETARTKPSNLDQAIAVARADLALGRVQEALAVLTPYRAQAESHLGLSATLALAAVGGNICPGLTGATGNEILCAHAWDSLPAAKEHTEILKKAWASKKGRDERAVETFIGVVYVVPWIYAAITATGADRAGLASSFHKRITELSQASEEAVSVSASFKGLKLFVDTLSAALAAAGDREKGERVVVKQGTQEALLARARELEKSQPNDRFTHAGVLAVAAMLAQERDVLPLVDGLSKDMSEHHRVTREVLRVWSAVGAQKAPLASDAAGGIAQLLPDERKQPLERAKLVMLLAESEAAVTHAARAQSILAQVSSQLLAEGTPAELRLRGAADRAGVLASQGQPGAAADLLEKVVSSAAPTVASETDRDLYFITRAYLFALRAMGAKGDERVEYRDKLAALTKGSDADSAPSSLRLFAELWLREIDYQIEIERCGALKVCANRALAKRVMPKKEIVDRIGAQSATLLHNGVVPAGTLNLSFNFSAGSGLEPLVRFEPRLLALEPPAWVMK